MDGRFCSLHRFLIREKCELGEFDFSVVHVCDKGKLQN